MFVHPNIQQMYLLIIVNNIDNSYKWCFEKGLKNLTLEPG